MPLYWYRRPRMVVLNPSSSVLDAARAIEQNRIGAVLVQDRGRLVGVVTDCDLAVRVLGQSLDAKATRIADVMTPSPVALSPEDKLTDAIRLMQEDNVRRIPLVEAGRIVGMVTLDDLLLDEAAPLEELAAIVQAQIGEGGPADSDKTPARRRSLSRAQATLARMVKQVQAEAALEGADKARAALDVVAASFARRVTPDEAEDFISQLPSLLHSSLQALRPGPDKSVTRESMEAELAAKLGIDRHGPLPCSMRSDVRLRGASALARSRTCEASCHRAPDSAPLRCHSLRGEMSRGDGAMTRRRFGRPHHHRAWTRQDVLEQLPAGALLPAHHPRGACSSSAARAQNLRCRRTRRPHPRSAHRLHQRCPDSSRPKGFESCTAPGGTFQVPDGHHDEGDPGQPPAPGRGTRAAQLLPTEELTTSTTIRLGIGLVKQELEHLLPALSSQHLTPEVSYASTKSCLRHRPALAQRTQAGAVHPGKVFIRLAGMGHSTSSARRRPDRARVLNAPSTCPCR